MGHIRDVATKGPKPSFFATASGVPFKRFHAHTKETMGLFKIGGFSTNPGRRLGCEDYIWWHF